MEKTSSTEHDSISFQVLNISESAKITLKFFRNTLSEIFLALTDRNLKFVYLLYLM